MHLRFEADDGQVVERRFTGTSTTDVYRHLAAPEQDEGQEVRLMLEWDDLEAGSKVSVWYEASTARNVLKSVEIHR